VLRIEPIGLTRIKLTAIRDNKRSALSKFVEINMLGSYMYSYLRRVYL
jgi:hypothetical protein